MIVLKLGGSLLSSSELIELLQLASQQRQLVIVPGGGVFADQVRLTQQQWQYDDKTAHSMAVLAMQQMALLFQGLCPELVLVNQLAEIPGVLQRQQVAVWSPLLAELDAGGIPANWEITSDSLAAWLAIRLSALKLILLKFAPIPEGATLEQLSRSGIIDKAFMRMVQKKSLSIDCISSHPLSVLASSLKNNV